MAALKYSDVADRRRRVEAQTGAIANMRQFGFLPAKYAESGEVTRWSTIGKGRAKDTPGWIIQRTHKKTWRIAYIPGTQRYDGRGCAYPIETRIGDGITFTGPVAAATWLAVEKSNGNEFR